MKKLALFLLLVLLCSCMTRVVKLKPGEVYSVKEGETVIIRMDDGTNPMDEIDFNNLKRR